MIELVDYLKTNGLEALESQFGVKVSRHGKYPNLVLLKYDQIESPKDVKIVQQCRGIILDENDNWNIVSRAFDRFFNYGEILAANIDWNSVTVQNKLDGSMISMFNYNNEWLVATSGTADAHASLPSLKTVTFDEIFWKVWKDLGYSLPKRTDCSYVFELMVPGNKVVVQYQKSNIVLLGARNIQTQHELNPREVATENGWKSVIFYDLSTIEDIIEASVKINPLENEGYVICDKDFNRIKVKSPQYVVLHYLVSTMSTRKMTELIVLNEGSEFLAYSYAFPELVPLYQEIKRRYDDFILFVNSFYDKYKNISDQKEFALSVKDSDIGGLCFSLRAGRGSVKELLRKTHIKYVENWLKIKNLNLDDLFG